MSNCIFFHKWEKWEEYLVTKEVTYLGIMYPKEVRGRTLEKQEVRQKRKCLRCGKVQDELIQD